jgi:hypothetical protein
VRIGLVAQVAGWVLSVGVGVLAYRRQRTRFRREVPRALGFAFLAFVFSIPTLIWWAIADKRFIGGRTNRPRR